jgi:hypothetical protein
MADEIDHEEAPQAGQVRIGIELEGVGTISMKWDKPFPQLQQLDSRVAFQATFKRMKLLRSASFNNLNRGVYLSPEEVSVKPNQGLLGQSHPAELVSCPHLLDLQNLEHLRDSVTKALTDAKTPLVARANYKEQRTQTVDLPRGLHGNQSLMKLHGQQVESKWGRVKAQIGGNLQTTVGVCVEKLCSSTKATREAVVKYMAATSQKQNRLLAFIAASIRAQETLAADQITVGAGTDAPYRLRLAILMYLLQLFAPALKGTGYEKDAYGCNIKGYSSFVGCGLSVANDALRTAARLRAMNLAIENNEMNLTNRLNGITTRLGAAIEQALNDNGAAALIPQFRRDFNYEHIGSPGLSLQVKFELAPAIPCFLKNDKLYTVIEARQRDSMLNTNMAAFLNGTSQAAGFLGQVREALGN